MRIKSENVIYHEIQYKENKEGLKQIVREIILSLAETEKSNFYLKIYEYKVFCLNSKYLGFGRCDCRNHDVDYENVSFYELRGVENER